MRAFNVCPSKTFFNLIKIAENGGIEPLRSHARQFSRLVADHSAALSVWWRYINRFFASCKPICAQPIYRFTKSALIGIPPSGVKGIEPLATVLETVMLHHYTKRLYSGLKVYLIFCGLGTVYFDCVFAWAL